MRIFTEQDLETNIEALIAIEPKFQQAYQSTGLPPMRKSPEGFTALYHILVDQQLSVAAANSIWNKLTLANLISAENVLAASDEDLRTNGLSKQKIRYVKALAQADIDYLALQHLPADAVMKILTAVLGIGEWTAEIYLLFSLGHADVFAAKDIALQEAAKHLFDLESRPNDRALKTMAQVWTPYRSAAARLLWAYYRFIKNREGISKT